MANILDYLNWRGDLSLQQSPFSEADAAVLARLAYLPFEKLPAFEKLSLAETLQQLVQLPDLKAALLDQEDRNLIRRLAESPRFTSLPLLRFVRETDRASQTQFSALSLELSPSLVFLSFRGTDNSLVGWKEDFNMSFTSPVPAQERAVRYLEELAQDVSGRLMLGGHSKGGNLAVYAAACCAPATQERIADVFNFDGPGFHEQILKSAGYRAIQSKLHRFVPQGSVVGMLLGHEETPTIVRSRQVGPWQHDLYSWQLERSAFLRVSSLDRSSLAMDKTLKNWLTQLDASQREAAIDALYGLVSGTEAETLDDLGGSWFSLGKSMLKAVGNLDENSRQAVTSSLQILLQSAKNNVLRRD